MERSDNSSRLDDVNAAATAALSSQKDQPSLKPKRKKHKLLCVGVLFLLAAALPIPLLLQVDFLQSYEEYEEREYQIPTHFFVSRDGVLFDLSTLDPAVCRMAITNSSDYVRGLTYPRDRALSASATTAVRLKPTDRWRIEDYQYEELADEELPYYFRFGKTRYAECNGLPGWMRSYPAYSIETSSLLTDEVVSSEKLFDHPNPDDGVYARCLLIDDKILFERGPYNRRYEESYDEQREDYFWYVKSNDQWTKIPLDFGIKENVVVIGHEVVREKKSILFLLFSRIGETDHKAYVSSYNYETFSVEKTIELPFSFSSDGPERSDVLSAQLRVLSGARHFYASQTVWKEETKSKTLNCIVFSMQDLTKVKELAVPNFKGDDVVISPDLRYVAYGCWNFYLYDLELQQEYCLRSHLPTLLKRSFADAYRKLTDSEHRREHSLVPIDYAAIYSFNFSEDSRFLLAADLLGNAYQWDVQNKKRARKIINSRY